MVARSRCSRSWRLSRRSLALRATSLSCAEGPLARPGPGVGVRRVSLISWAMSGKWRRKVVLDSPSSRATARTLGRRPLLVACASTRSRARRACSGVAMVVTSGPGCVG
jgi:hypothetical protein